MKDDESRRPSLDEQVAEEMAWRARSRQPVVMSPPQPLDLEREKAALRAIADRSEEPERNVEDISVCDLIDEAQHAHSDPGLTVQELTQRKGLSKTSVLRRLHALIAIGKVVVGRRTVRDIAGRLQHIPVYRVVEITPQTMNRK